VEQWAEIGRLHNSEGVPIKEISRRLGIARNAVRSALASSEPPKYKRAPKGSLADAFSNRRSASCWRSIRRCRPR